MTLAHRPEVRILRCAAGADETRRERGKQRPGHILLAENAKRGWTEEAGSRYVVSRIVVLVWPDSQDTYTQLW